MFWLECSALASLQVTTSTRDRRLKADKQHQGAREGHVSHHPKHDFIQAPSRIQVSQSPLV